MRSWSEVFRADAKSKARPKTTKELLHVIPINGGKGIIAAGFKIEMTLRATRFVSLFVCSFFCLLSCLFVCLCVLFGLKKFRARLAAR